MKQWILDPARGVGHYNEECQRSHRASDLEPVDKDSPCFHESMYIFMARWP